MGYQAHGSTSAAPPLPAPGLAAVSQSSSYEPVPLPLRVHDERAGVAVAADVASRPHSHYGVGYAASLQLLLQGRQHYGTCTSTALVPVTMGAHEQQSVSWQWERAQGNCAGQSRGQHGSDTNSANEVMQDGSW
eukprot:CAMPEP_0114422712 /NCGR_PEP_ID=MMETSP0103-20121206/5755_1 /TAXON_ID=37642 ORGANISM="Paraphysomonas imperforata, Strain PA2" /NCGR_SAMPLE_ID=MMETSP0103 /ASSEMBLY_ACC=CAM_ASM_000201 /LENGTH=133 /DNA_ID=CAMNT_0001591313 /DNA_START=134 /DNA_END=534 /DNA_ORIENTATION=-